MYVLKAKLRKLDVGGQSFSLQRTGQYHSFNELHYHPEIELIYVVEGTGTLLAGDKIEPVSRGSLYLLGSNLPHLFRFETHAYTNALLQQGKIELPLQLLTLHFNPDIFGPQFLGLPENSFIKTMLRNAMHAQEFYGSLKIELVSMLNRLLNASVYERIPLLMQLLAAIAEGKEYRLFNSTVQQAVFNATDETRLTKIYLHTLNNFHRNITLKEIAATVYMVPNAFCRYFKSRVHKSYFDFLLEVRVNHALKLLKETNYSMAVISYESGFTNLSNFNRYFKAITGKKPLQCRKEFRSLA